MFTRGNSKLGYLIWSWAMTVGKTCPGASALCEMLCYAKRGRFTTDTVKDAHAKRTKLAKTKEFVAAAITEIREKCIQIMRVHVAGDYEDEEYIRKWIQIVKSCRRTTFYMYTRSWDVPELLPALVELGRQENVCMFFSTDRTMTKPPYRKGIYWCYLMEDDEDEPTYVVDLVFRNQHRTEMKRVSNGSLVCPYENGVTSTTCSKCGLCFMKDRLDAASQRKKVSRARKEAAFCV